MRNISVEYISGDDGKPIKMVIEVDLTKDYGPSSTGRTNIVACTDGITQMDDDLSDYKMNMAVFRRNPKE